jgi:hypothetical protein
VIVIYLDERSGEREENLTEATDPFVFHGVGALEKLCLLLRLINQVY